MGKSLSPEAKARRNIWNREYAKRRRNDPYFLTQENARAKELYSPEARRIKYLKTLPVSDDELDRRALRMLVAEGFRDSMDGNVDGKTALFRTESAPR